MALKAVFSFTPAVSSGVRKLPILLNKVTYLLSGNKTKGGALKLAQVSLDK